jgi:5-methyltetrahydrofolate--homocysteine methyltransferase
METAFWSRTARVVASPARPAVVIGERINPTGRKKMSEALKTLDMTYVVKEALGQVAAGAAALDVNVGAEDVDFVAAMVGAIEAISAVTPVPLVIDTGFPDVLEAALKAYDGKALVNSVNGEARALDAFLPLVKEFRAAVIGLCMDDEGISNDPEQRLAIARRIVTRAEREGIPVEDVVIDPLTMTVGADDQAARITLETMRLVRRELGVNLTGGASNISFGLPERRAINQVFLAMLLANGMNCPITDPTHPEIRSTLLVADLLNGHDAYAANYLKAYRAQQEAAARAAQAAPAS